MICELCQYPCAQKPQHEAHLPCTMNKMFPVQKGCPMEKFLPKKED